MGLRYNAVNMTRPVQFAVDGDSQIFGFIDRLKPMNSHAVFPSDAVLL